MVKLSKYFNSEGEKEKVQKTKKYRKNLRLEEEEKNRDLWIIL